MQLHAKTTAQVCRIVPSSAVCPVATACAGSRRRRAVATANNAAVLDAPVQTPLQTSNCHADIPLVTEQLSEASLLKQGFLQEFTMGETLGQGSYGTVRACTHAPSGKQYAVKILSKRKSNEERTEVIMREVQLWAMLSKYPHVADLVGAYEDANNIFIVQELLTGGDLQSLLDAQGTLNEQDAAAAMRSILAALAACHEVDVCYGDVKPSNFMLANMWPSIMHMLDPSQPKGEMQIRVIDFGCAQYCPHGCSLLQGLSGTPVYMAPEVIVDHCHSVSMDVWAAGVMLYQMLTGQFPFWDTDMAGLGRIHPRKILKDVQNADVLLDASVCANLSAEAKDLISKMLVKDPAHRLTAAQALQHPWLQHKQ